MTTKTTHPEHANLGYAEGGDRTLMGDTGHWHLTGQARKWVRGTIKDCNEAYASQVLEDFSSLPGKGSYGLSKETQVEPVFPQVERGRIHFLSGDLPTAEEYHAPNEPTPIHDEVLLEQIRTADEALDPTPESLVHPIDQILEGVSDEDAPEALRQHLSALAGHEVTMTRVDDQDLLRGLPEGTSITGGDEETRAFLQDALEETTGRRFPLATGYQHVKPERGGKRSCTTPDCSHSESRHNASGACRTCDCEHFRIDVEA